MDGFELNASSFYSKYQYFYYNPVKFGATDKNDYDNFYHVHNKDLPRNYQKK